MTYLTDLSKGHKAEEYIRQLFAAAGIKSELNASRKKKDLLAWDIEATLDKVQFYVECKYDLYEARSGNVAIEYFNVKTATDSGLMATSADIWCHVLDKPMTAWVCRVSDLKEYFHKKPCHRNIPCGGDDNSSMKLYVRERIFGDIFTQIDNLNKEQLRTVLRNLLINK